MSDEGQEISDEDETDTSYEMLVSLHTCALYIAFQVTYSYICDDVSCVSCSPHLHHTITRPSVTTVLVIPMRMVYH